MSNGNIENLLTVPNLETFLKDHLIINKELFLAIREESITVYYWGKSMFELAYFADRKCTVKIQKRYVNHTSLIGLKFIEKSDYMVFAFSDTFIQVFLESYDTLKDNVEKLIDENQSIDEKAGSLGQKYQGIIACNNNSSKDSDWYCADLDYCPEDAPFGRFDLVAISKNSYNDKHRIMIINVKYSWQAYKSGYRKNLYNNKKNKGFYIQARDLKTRKNAAGLQHPKRFGCKFDEKKNKVISYDFGSGIAGDFYNYSRFLFENNEEYVNRLKEELYDILNAKKKIGSFKINDHIGGELDKLLGGSKEEFVSHMAENAECVFLTVGCESLDKCKESMTSYLCPGPTNTADILSCTKDTWNLYYNNGKGKLQHLVNDLSLADAFPEKFDEQVRYIFSENESLENLNLINHPDLSCDAELILNIFS